MLALFKKELFCLFISPVAWAILAVTQGLLAYLFLGYIENYQHIQARLSGIENAPGYTQLVAAPLFATSTLLCLFLIPLLTMRSISEERRDHSLALLLSAPLSMTQIIAAKFAALMIIIALLSALVFCMALSVAGQTYLDIGIIFSSALGQCLMLMSFAALGLYLSCLCTQPMVAALSTFALLLLLWMLDLSGNSGAQPSGELFAYFSLLNHYQAMLRGHIDSADLAFYGLFTGLFLFLAVQRLGALREVGD